MKAWVSFWLTMSAAFASISLYAIAWYGAVILRMADAVPAVLGSGFSAATFAVIGTVIFWRLGQ